MKPPVGAFQLPCNLPRPRSRILIKGSTYRRGAAALRSILPFLRAPETAAALPRSIDPALFAVPSNRRSFRANINYAEAVRLAARDRTCPR